MHCDVGDEVEVFGWLNSFAPAKNPGGFDPAAFYQRQGIRCMLRADHPDAVRLLHAGSPLSIWRCAARLRAEGEALFARDLSPRTGPVAAALLFGGRMQMDEEIRDAFTQSGLLHVLAISGMHVAILGVLLWGIGRLAGLSVRGTCALIIVGVLGYTILTDCNPPVIRATVMVCLYAGARFFLRRPALSNCLALSAVVILLWNPTDLFNTGTQLSFLAVLGIVWACGRRTKQAAPDLANAPEPDFAIVDSDRQVRRLCSSPVMGRMEHLGGRCPVHLAAGGCAVPPRFSRWSPDQRRAGTAVDSRVVVRLHPLGSGASGPGRFVGRGNSIRLGTRRALVPRRMGGARSTFSLLCPGTDRVVACRLLPAAVLAGIRAAGSQLGQSRMVAPACLDHRRLALGSADSEQSTRCAALFFRSVMAARS